MGLNVPTHLIKLLSTCYRHIFPQVHDELKTVKQLAQTIPNDELRTQALASIETKTFHCEGGSVYASLAGDSWKDAIHFIVAYQTISDYLDNLCDRSQSLDPEDFRLLHRSMTNALSPQPTQPINYYEKRADQEDHGYLQSLVEQCQRVIKKIDNYELIYPYVKRLSDLYIDLQVHKHVAVSERVPRLTSWFEEENEHQGLSWYEFSAASGSTLGIFCLVSYALQGQYYGNEVMKTYFPFVQGLHILLDYFIDQKEDEREGDLNFCHYYENDDEMMERLQFFVTQSLSYTSEMPDASFHKLIQSGLVGLYLSDSKTNSLNNGKKLRQRLLKHAGMNAKIIYWNGRVYRKWKKKRDMDE
ncbi:tetraprenyl-beta-curcumene synthase family protein [Bacillaceae bacterium W0354]